MQPPEWSDEESSRRYRYNAEDADYRELGDDDLLEEDEENPFLERFYQNPRQAALPTQNDMSLSRNSFQDM